MKKTILITGGLGFIGSNLVRRLLKNTTHNLIIADKETYAGRKDNIPLDKKSLERMLIINADVTIKKDMEKLIKKSQIVIHMAAETNAAKSLHQEVSTIFTNVMGTSILLEAAAKY